MACHAFVGVILQRFVTQVGVLVRSRIAVGKKRIQHDGDALGWTDSGWRAVMAQASRPSESGCIMVADVLSDFVVFGAFRPYGPGLSDAVPKREED